MIRLTQAIVSVMASTLSGGVAGGVVGATIGRLAPSFVSWLHTPGGPAPNTLSPEEFGLGVGAVCGLLMGASTGLFLTCVLAIRDAWLARAGLTFPTGKDDRGDDTFG